MTLKQLVKDVKPILNEQEEWVAIFKDIKGRWCYVSFTPISGDYGEVYCYGYHILDEEVSVGHKPEGKRIPRSILKKYEAQAAELYQLNESPSADDIKAIWKALFEEVRKKIPKG